MIPEIFYKRNFEFFSTSPAFTYIYIYTRVYRCLHLTWSEMLKMKFSFFELENK